MKGKRFLALVILLMFVIMSVATGCASKTAAPQKEAEKWPTKPITIMVAVAAGGGVDAMARGLAQYWSKHLGVPVVVENKEGGAGMVGLNEFLRRPDDGQTLFVFHQTKLSAGYLLDPNQKYGLDTFSFINAQESDPATIVVNKDSKYQNLQQLVEDIKANPDKLALGTMVQTGTHLASLMFLDKLGLKARVVTYSGGNDFRMNLTGKQIDFGFSNGIGDYGFKDEFRVLAVFTEQPFDLYPEAPTINEALKPYNVTMPMLGSVRNVLTHATFRQKYPERYKILVDTYKATLEDPDYKAFLQKTGALSGTHYYGEEKSLEINKAYEDVLRTYKDLFKQTK